MNETILCLIIYQNLKCSTEVFSATKQSYGEKIYYDFDHSVMGAWSISSDALCKAKIDDDVVYSICLNDLHSIAEAKSNMIDAVNQKIEEHKQKTANFESAKLAIAS